MYLMFGVWMGLGVELWGFFGHRYCAPNKVETQRPDHRRGGHPRQQPQSLRSSWRELRTILGPEDGFKNPSCTFQMAALSRSPCPGAASEIGSLAASGQYYDLVKLLEARRHRGPGVPHQEGATPAD